MDKSKIEKRGNSLVKCVMCGNFVEESQTLVLSNEVKGHVCIQCLEDLNESYQEITKQTTKKSEDMPNIKLSKPSIIKKFLDKYVIGQTKAKEILSVAVYNHLKRIKMRELKKEECDIDKSNVFLIGASGSGKTYLLKTLSKGLKVPFVTVDATAFTSSGYVGRDVETILTDLYNAADQDKEAAEHGIIYIDEIDKIGRKGENLSTTADPGNEGTQQALLKLIEGSMVKFPVNGGRLHPDKECMEMNTENILFIVGGAFEGIEKIIAQRLKKGKSSIGFGSAVTSKEPDAANILDATADDLKKFGMIPELIGRIPVICPLEKLDEETLVTILTKPKRALVGQYKQLFEADDVALDITPEALRYVAQKAIKMGTGARALRSVMEEILLPVMYEAPDKLDEMDTVRITIKDDKPAVEYLRLKKEEIGGEDEFFELTI